VVEEDQVERIVVRGSESVRSKRIGGDRVFVSPVDDAIRARAGERGHDAIV